MFVPFFDLRAAAVRHHVGGLLNQQTFFDECQIDPSATDLAGEAVVIAVWIKTEERQAKAVLAAGGAVATARVAASLHENGHHIELEADGDHLPRPLDVDRHRDGKVGKGHCERGVAIGERLDQAPLDCRSVWLRDA